MSKTESKETPEQKIANALIKANITIDNWGDSIEEPEAESIAMYGATRVGKSNQYLNLFEYDVLCALEAGMSGQELPRLFILNTDRSTKRDLENYPLLRELGVVHMVKVFTGQQIMAATIPLTGAKALGIHKQIMRPNKDWFVMDRATDAWRAWPNYWAVETMGKSADKLEFEHQTKEEGKIKGGSAMLQHYARGINPSWFGWVNMIQESGAHHIFVCTEQDLVTEKQGTRDKDDQEKINNFAAVGVVPAMQGDTWAKFHTQLHLSRPFIKKEFYVRTVGERGSREWLGTPNRQPLGNTSENGLGAIYLGRVCNWRARYGLD